jgi:hypothetical protein
MVRGVVLFEQRFWAGLLDGTITVAFRRWRRPHSRTGGTQRIPGGVLAVDAVDVVVADAIGEDNARRSGFGSRADLLAELDGRGDDPIYRVRFHFAGPDPRERLRERSELTPDEATDLTRRLERLDRAGRNGPWTALVLRTIAQRPGVRAGDLAEALGREMQPFKRDVRKLKELGLTESLEVGYRLSPRGRSALERLDLEAGRPSGRIRPTSTERGHG